MTLRNIICLFPVKRFDDHGINSKFHRVAKKVWVFAFSHGFLPSFSYQILVWVLSISSVHILVYSMNFTFTAVIIAQFILSKSLAQAIRTVDLP